MHTAGIRRIATDAAGRLAVTASDDKTARVWDVASGRLLQTLRIPVDQGFEGTLFAAALAPDGRLAAVGGWTEPDAIFLFDPASGRLLQRLTGLPNVIIHMAFSPDGRWLAASLGGSNGVRVWRVNGQQVDATPQSDSSYGGDSYGATFSQANRLATTSEDGKVRLYDLGRTPMAKLAEVAAPGGKDPFQIAFSPDGSELAVGYADTTRVDILDGRSLALRHTPGSEGVANGNLSSVAWSADGRSLWAGGQWSRNGQRMVRRWPNAGRGAPQDVATLGDSISDLKALPNGGVLVAGGGPAWGVLSASGQWQPLGQAPVADLRGSRGNNGYALSADARTVQFGYEEWVQAPHRFNLRQRSLVPGKDATLSVPQVDGVPSLQVKDWQNTTHPGLNGQPLKLGQYEMSRSLALVPGGQSLVLGADWTLRHFSATGQPLWEKPAPGATWGVNLSADGRLIVAAYGDGTLRWHRVSDGQELLAFFPHADRKRWVLWTPSGYYDASPGGEELIGWHINRGMDAAADFFPASRFRARFNRPDVIDRILDTLDEAQALRDADQASNRRSEATSIAQVLPPVVEVVSGNDVTTAQGQISIRIRARTAADAPVTGLRVRVDGQLQPDARGLQRQEAAGANNAERELTIPVPPKDSTVEVFAENRHGTSVPAQVRVKWSGTKPQAQAPSQTAANTGFQIQPKLYVLAVGVGAYQHKDISRLGLPAKDAQDFATTLRAQKGKLYRDVEVKLLTDGQATADAVVDGLDWLQKQVTQHDVGMVFIAGHGVNDPTQGYTYLPVNADPDRLRRTGVPMDEFKKTLGNLPGKAVFFFDTCHAGNVLGPKSRSVNDVSAVINELSSAESGVVVFTSSTGRQLSYEDAAWGNGAFTKALVEGLNGGADYQKTGRITHKMLDLYVSERVKQLTGGKQSPVTQAPGGVPDFPLAVK
jgi:WD40 repeat protein